MSPSPQACVQTGEDRFACAQTDFRFFLIRRNNMKKLFCIILTMLLLSGCAGNFGDMELKDSMAIPESGIIGKEMIQQIKDENAVAVFYGESNGLKYEWKLFGKDIEDAKDVNLQVDLLLSGEELIATFAQQEAMGFAAMLSIHLQTKWSYLTASAYQNDAKVYSVSFTGTKEYSILNFYVTDTLGVLHIRPDDKKDPTLTDPTTPSTPPDATDPSHIHKYEATIIAPTCTEGGYTVYTCVCADSYRENETEATGHSWGQWTTVKEPTTTDTGEAQRKCNACNESESRTLPKVDATHTHSYTAVVTKPTCTQSGYTTHTCSCGDTYRDASVAATGHTWDAGTVTKAATCAVKGEKAFHCTCGATRTEAIPTIAHDYKTTTVAPSGGQQGYDLHTCQGCGATYKDNYKDQYLTDPIPDGMPTPVEPDNAVVDKGTVYTCSFSIECSTILNNLENLNPSKLEILPSDGVILAEIEVEFYAGESVFDVLQRVCRENKIHMESSWTPMYNSAYIEGIANFYEFDCGDLSGWMYRVNGWYPNYGCSRYQLQDGDVVEWRYTCDLGRDVGDNYLAGTY